MIRLALIGCGRVAAAYPEVMPRVQRAAMTATADSDRARATRMATELDAELSATSLDELLDSHADAFDAVLINTPNDSHAALTQRAAEAGKHVLVAPPLGLSLAQADAAIEACGAAGVRLMVGEAARFKPYQQTIKSNLDSGNLGELGLLRMHRWEPPVTGGWGRWELDPERSGGLLLRQAVQELDTATWFFGGLPNSVYALGRTRSSADLPVSDEVLIHLGFEGGGMAVIDYTTTLPAGDAYASLEAIGSTGAAYADDHHNMQLLYGGGRPSGMKTGQGQGYLVAQLEEFAQAIEQGREPAISGADGRSVIQIATTAGESMRSGRAARLTGDGYALV
jgi:predicted dehydrogenase